MRLAGATPRATPSPGAHHEGMFMPAGPHYKWIALSNTTLGMLMATVNSSIMLIALPDIFRGIGVDPLQPGNTTLLLWLLMGYLVVTAVLVVSFCSGRPWPSCPPGTPPTSPGTPSSRR